MHIKLHLKKLQWLPFCLVCLFTFLVSLPYCKKEVRLNIRLEEKFSIKGDGKTSFYDPGGIAVDRDGNIYVADSGNYRVVLSSYCDKTYAQSRKGF
jgi:hypothetical protein